MIMAEDYGLPYSQVQGFMSGCCKAGGRVPKKAWVPVGNKDFSSVIASIPEDVDSLLVVLAGADAVNFMRQYEQAGGDKRSEEHTSELQSLMRISYADSCLQTKAKR